MTELPQEQFEGIESTLRDLRLPTSLDQSPWVESCLVSQRIREEPQITAHEAIRQVFTGILVLLEEANPNYADLLRGLFWEGLTWDEMMNAQRPRSWASVTTFNKHRKKAIDQFAYILWQKEQACQREHQPEDKISILPSHEEHVPNTPKPIYKQPWIALGTVAAIVAIGFIIFTLQNASFADAPRPSPSPTTLQAMIVTTSTNVVAVCGESDRTAVPDATRFLRSQGISAFSVENTNGIVLNNYVRTLAVDPRGLWIGYFATEQNVSTGLGHYDKKTWADCNQTNGTAGKDINAIAIDQIGKIWIATEKAGVAMFDGQNWFTFTKRDGLPSDETFGLTIDAQNVVWVGTWEGVAKFDVGSWSVPYSVQNNTIFNNHVHAIRFDSSGNIWVGHVTHGISQYDAVNSKWLHHTTETSQLGGNKVRDIVVRKADGSGYESIWVATADGGVSKFEQGQWTVYSIQNGLPSNNVRAVAIDKYNRVWAATARGVAYFDGSNWIIYNTIDTTSIAFGPKCQTCPFDDEHVWTGTVESGLTHSRLPYFNDAIDVIEVCFVSETRERSCEPINDEQDTDVITATYSKAIAPGETFRPEFVVAPRVPYQFREDRGDFLSNTDQNDANLFGAYPIIPVKGTINSGQPYTFIDYDNPFRVPQLAESEHEKIFTSTWRVWTHTRYAGPYIRITFTVRNP